MPIKSKLSQIRAMARRNAKWLAITGGLEAISLADRLGLVAKPQCKGVIFTLHQVRPDNNADFNPNSFLSITPQFLESVIHLVQELGWHPVHLEALPALLADPDSQKRYVAFTLDDGYRDNREFAYPIFQKHGVPFTVFVAAGFTHRSRTMWWITLAEMLAKNETITLDLGETEHNFVTRTKSEKFTAFSEISDKLNHMDEDLFVSQIDAAARAAGIEPLDIVVRETLDEKGLRDFATDPLVRLGAHTVNHINLARANTARLNDEINQSSDHVEVLTGSKPTSFAFPYGSRAAASKREFDAAADHGFTVAVTTHPGLLQGEHSATPTGLPRVSLNGYYQDVRYVKALLTGIPFKWLGGSN